MEQKESLGKRIAMLRKEKGLTQEQLAEKVGVSAQAVSKWENDVSCPDITILPLLADILGVTVDELLGVKPIEPHVIILDKDETLDDKDKKKGKVHWSWEFNKKSGKWYSIALPIGLILVCLFFLLHRMAGLFPYIETEEMTLKGWNYIWPLLIFTFGLCEVREHIAMGAALMAWGGYEFVRRVLIPYGVSLIPIPWYVVLLVFAIALLLMVIIGKTHRFIRRAKEEEYTDKRTPVLEVNQDNNYLKADMSFGGGVVTYDGDTLNGGEIDMNFGDYKIDLRNVRTFSSNCLLKIDQNFGSLTVFLPKNVRIVKSSDTSFGSFATYGEPSPDATQSLIIRADVNFGTLQVKYE